jgi:hypothetical protein
MSKLNELQEKLQKAKTNKQLPDNLRAKLIAKFEKEIAALDEKKDGSSEKSKRGPKPKVKATAIEFDPKTDDWKKTLQKALNENFGENNRETNPKWDLDYYYLLNKEANERTILFVEDGMVYISTITALWDDENQWDEVDSLIDASADGLAEIIAKAKKIKSKGTEKSKSSPVKSDKKTYKGKSIEDLDDKDCDELLKEVAERRAAARKSAKKSEKKPVIEKVSAPIVRGVEKAIKNIDTDDISAKKIKQVKDAIEATKAFITSLKTLLGDDYNGQAVTDEIKPLLKLAKKIEEKFLKTEK